MGRYLNPKNMTKEDWLKTNAVFANDIIAPPTWTNEIDGKSHVLACLIDNGMFTACGLCFNQREYEAFSDMRDGRFKYFYWVPDNLTEEFK